MTILILWKYGFWWKFKMAAAVMLNFAESRKAHWKWSGMTWFICITNLVEVYVTNTEMWAYLFPKKCSIHHLKLEKWSTVFGYISCGHFNVIRCHYRHVHATSAYQIVLKYIKAFLVFQVICIYGRYPSDLLECTWETLDHPRSLVFKSHGDNDMLLWNYSSLNFSAVWLENACSHFLLRCWIFDRLNVTWPPEAPACMETRHCRWHGSVAAHLQWVVLTLANRGWDGCSWSVRNSKKCTW